MSAPTPIEIVRESLAKLQDPFVMFHARPEKKAFTIALASVLRDAERFNALERALTDDKIFVSTPDPHDDDLWAPHDGTLAELADKLRSETK